MDGRLFDELTRALGAGATRRGAIGAAAGALAALLGIGAEAAPEAEKKGEKGKCRRPGAKCGRGDTCCGGRCRKGRCVCTKNRKRCGNRCIGKRACCTNGKPGCPAGQACQAGRCAATGCTPEANPCGDRRCGVVQDRCGNDVVCGSCPGGQSCGPNGQCAATGCTPEANPCGARVCGTVTDRCGNPVACGPLDGACPAGERCTANGTCECVPEENPCGNRVCGTVQDRCGTTVACGPLNGACPDGRTCSENGRCQCGGQECAGCCDNGVCRDGFARNACGSGGETCRACGPDLTCVAGECTCTPSSCAQGCCENGVCHNDKRPCGNTCIPKDQCCANRDRTPGCRENETCVFNNATGYAECRCGNFVCRANQGCCVLDGNGNPTCDTSKRPCGDACMDKTECCTDGQVTCEDGFSCTSATCVPQSGTGQNPPPGICQVTFNQSTCPEMCDAGRGYGNGYPLDQEVQCGAADANGMRCYCWRTTEGTNVCTRESYDTPDCRTSADCPAGTVCIRSGIVTGGAHSCEALCS